MMTKSIKVGLTLLLFLCLLDVPYGYYQFVRFTALFGFGILAYHAYEDQQLKVMIIYLALALLFQPFIKVALGREIWNFVDILVGLGLLLSLFLSASRSN